MEIKVRERDGTTIISIQGEVDAMTAPELNGMIDKQIDQGRVKLVIDFEQVNFMSSAGLRVLLAGVKSSRKASGDLRLASLQEGVYKTLDISGFTAILQIFPDVEEAVTSFT